MNIQKQVGTVVTIAVVCLMAMWLGATLYSEIPLTAKTNTNESWNTSTPGTWVSLSCKDLVCGSQTVKNATLATSTNTTDYILGCANSSIQGQNTTTLPENTTAYIDYNCKYRATEQKTVFTNFLKGMEVVGVVVIIMAVIAIVTLVMKAFGGKREE